MTRLATVALVLLAVAVSVGFGGSAPATGPCRIHNTGTGVDYGFGVQGFDTELADGSFVLGADVKTGKSYKFRLVHVGSDCQIISTFPVPNSRVGIDVLAGTPDGRILVGGIAGRRAVVGRLFADGMLDRSFGVGGWRKLIRPGGAEARRAGGRLSFTVTSIAFGPTGTIVLGGSHAYFHGVLRFVSELTPNGRPIRTFGGDGSVNPPSSGSYMTTEVFANPDGSVLAYGEWSIFGRCGGPGIVRINTNGSFDSHFDKTIGRTITHFGPTWKVCFTPTLVPDGAGGFTLVGGLDRPYARPQPHSGGVSVPIGESGQMAGGLTHFRSPDFAFDSPATIRLPSGRTVVAGVQYTSGARAKAVLVQVFGPDGRRDLTIGDHGQLRYPIPLGTHTHWMTADLLPAPSGGVWLLTGLKREHDVTLLPVS